MMMILNKKSTLASLVALSAFDWAGGLKVRMDGVNPPRPPLAAGASESVTALADALTTTDPKWFLARYVIIHSSKHRVLNVAGIMIKKFGPKEKSEYVTTQNYPKVEVSGSSVHSKHTENNAIDGSIDTWFETEKAKAGSSDWIRFDLGEEVLIESITVIPPRIEPKRLDTCLYSWLDTSRDYYPDRDYYWSKMSEWDRYESEIGLDQSAVTGTGSSRWMENSPEAVDKKMRNETARVERMTLKTKF